MLLYSIIVTTSQRNKRQQRKRMYRDVSVKTIDVIMALVNVYQGAAKRNKT